MPTNTTSTFAVGLALGLLLTPAVGGEVFSVPTSNKLIEGELTLDGSGEVVKFAVLEGAMLTVRDSETGLYHGFTPHIVDDEALMVTFTAFEILEHGPGLHQLRELETVEASGGLKALVPQAGYSQIEVKAVTTSLMTDVELKTLRSDLFNRTRIGTKPQLAPLKNN